MNAFVDAEWAGCATTRRSTHGYMTLVNDGPISWKNTMQTVVALSAESDYVALSTCAKDLTWIRHLYIELMEKRPYRETMQLPPTTIPIENTAALSLALTDQVSAKRKHIGVKYYHVRELIKMN